MPSDDTCPVCHTTELVGGKWTLLLVRDLADGLTWIADLPDEERRAMGRRAVAVVSEWGPSRFARGMIEAVHLAIDHERRRDRAGIYREVAR